jgi:hypothetical protein
MTNKHREMQFVIEEWKQDTGNIEINMHEVAEYAAKKGWPLPDPISALDRLAKELEKARACFGLILMRLPEKSW